MDQVMTVVKPLSYRGTSVLGMEVYVITEKIRFNKVWSCKIRINFPEGSHGYLWISDKSILVPKGNLTTALYGDS